MYRFKVTGGPPGPEPEPIELADMDAARVEATRLCGEIVRGEPDAIWGSDDLKIEVFAADGLLLYQIMVVGTRSLVAR